MAVMADHLELHANGNGPRVRVGGNRRRVRLSCDQLESRDATGSIVSGVVAAAFGGPLSDSLSELARLIGDWAFLDAAIRTSQPAGRIAEIADESPRTPARYDTWLDPQLLFPAERPERGVRVTAPTAPADPGRGAFGDLIGGPLHLSGPANSSPFPSFVGVRAAPAFAPNSPQSPPDVVGGIGAASVGRDFETLPFSVGTVIDAEYLSEPIPNNSPQAVADSITVSEDGSVVFDPSANDTDPDGDPLWVKLVQSETANGRTYWEEGGNVRYIPNPNFHGEDSFSYLVTDGLDYDGTVEGTVTVTVTPVNDECRAFDDAYFLPIAPGNPYPPQASVLTNDRDFDGDAMTAELVTPPSAGTLDFQPDGTFSYTRPSYIDPVNGLVTSFTYKAMDGKGSVSETVEAVLYIWPRQAEPPLGEEPPPPPTLVGVADTIPVGNNPLTGVSVTANDKGWTRAFLISQPGGNGRLTRFTSSGTFDYTPSHDRGDTAFSYRLVDAANRLAAAVPVNQPSVQLTIHHGQGGKAVSELNEQILIGGGSSINPLIPALFPTGGFTVANFNDSNANGMMDSDIRERGMIADPQFPGSGEVDLMKLVVACSAADATNKVTLTVSPGAVNTARIWRSALKEVEGPVLEVDGMMSGKSSSVAVAPGEYWVELTGVSGAVGDVKIEAKFGQATDTVNATGIWTAAGTPPGQWPSSDYFIDSGTTLPADLDSVTVHELFGRAGNKLGLNNDVPQPHLPAGWLRNTNTEVSKFKVVPSGMTPFTVLGILSFDATRSVDRWAQGVYYDQNLNLVTGKAERKHKPAWLDVANDQVPNQTDNDNTMLFNYGSSWTDHIYSIDLPGPAATIPAFNGVFTTFTAPAGNVVFARGKEQRYRANYWDFVRIRIGSGDWAGGEGVQGSRSSVYYPWSSLSWLEEANPLVAGGKYRWVRHEVPIPQMPQNALNSYHIANVEPT
jgi:hypothetical protein